MKRLIIIFLAVCNLAFGQPPKTEVQIEVVPDHSDWVYKLGEKIRFSVAVKRSGKLIPNTKIEYEIGPEKMEAFERKEALITSGQTVLEGGTLSHPGFLRCEVRATIDGKKYRGIATAAFSPLEIKPTAVVPEDFLTFWRSAIDDAEKHPLDPKLTLIPEKSTQTVNVYHVSFQNGAEKNSRIYGYLSIPKKEGKFPAMIRFPGAGVRAHSANLALAEKGIITLQIGIHGIPVNMEGDVYENLYRGALKGYPVFNLDSRDHYYFKRVYLGCVRSVDFIFNLPQFDEQNIAVSGSSQGGALSIVTAALDSRIKYVLAFCPALSDLTGFIHGRAGGWPNMFNKSNLGASTASAKIKTAGYYDVVNFARLLKIPGFYSWGFNDETTPPTSTYSFYNVITSPKELFILPYAAHYNYPEQTKKWNAWIEKVLTNYSH
ncbi:MAG TPA: acetylxylan esterase [Sphingobacteriaceae bacterium]